MSLILKLMWLVSESDRLLCKQYVLSLDIIVMGLMDKCLKLLDDISLSSFLAEALTHSK